MWPLQTNYQMKSFHFLPPVGAAWRQGRQQMLWNWLIYTFSLVSGNPNKFVQWLCCLHRSQIWCWVWPSSQITCTLSQKGKCSDHTSSLNFSMIQALVLAVVAKNRTDHMRLYWRQAQLKLWLALGFGALVLIFLDKKWRSLLGARFLGHILDVFLWWQ